MDKSGAKNLIVEPSETAGATPSSRTLAGGGITESGRKPSAKPTFKDKLPSLLLLLLSIATLIAVIVVIINVVNQEKIADKCKEAIYPSEVELCAENVTSRAEKLEIYRDGIARALNGVDNIGTIISVYQSYFDLIETNKFPELYADCIDNILSLDLYFEYGSEVLDYAKLYDGIIQDTNSARFVYNTAASYKNKTIQEEYIKIINERAEAAGEDINVEVVG